MNNTPAPAKTVPTPVLAARPTTLPVTGGGIIGKLFTLMFLAALFLPPQLFADDEFRLNQYTRYMALALFALSVDLIWGYTGLLSLGQGVYFALGAYAVGYSLKLQRAAQLDNVPVPYTSGPDMAIPDFMLQCRLEHVPGWIAPFIDIRFAIVVALLLPMLFALAFGWVTFARGIKGVYFSLFTQALLLAMFILVSNQRPYTGGVDGMTSLARLQLFGYTFKGSYYLYFVITSILVLCYFLLALLMRSKVGKVLTAIRDNEYRVMALGYNTAIYKTFAFALAGLLAGLAGGMYVAANRSTGPQFLGIAESIEVVVLVAVGGRGTLIGAILGTVVVSVCKTYINENYTDLWPLFLGGLFILITLFLPEGIVGLLRKGYSRLRALVIPQPSASQ